MKFIPQLPPAIRNRFTDGTPAKSAASFPPNLADKLTPDNAKKMLMFLSSNYIWPQIQERMPFEQMWDKLLDMARINMPNDQLFSNTAQDASKAKQSADQSNRDKARVADSVVHDSIQRLTDITYFIAFKENLPAQYAIPSYLTHPFTTPEYSPLADRVKAGNCILEWNSGMHDLRRNSLLAYRHHFTYGVSFVMSDFKFQVKMINRQSSNGTLSAQPELTSIGTTFEPISLRKLWLNWRLPVYDMESQPCPFFFDECPRFALLQNKYDPALNPFGYVNLDKLQTGTYIYSEPEMGAVRDALAKTHSQMSNTSGSHAVAQILEPKYSVEAKWMLFPLMPFDPATGEFEKRADGSDIPYQRFIMETFGPNVHSGQQVILRLQENFYPEGKLPIYGSAHMPDLDSGAYSPSIGQLLYNHYREITLCYEQYFQNKDLINDPSAWCQTSSPAYEKDLNAKGAKIPVNGPNDFGWRPVTDATSSTVAMLQMLREGAQTTGKVVDAVLGKAMGSRTSATEASNAYQAGMSAITTDIDMISHDLHGAYAERVWDYTGTWFDPDLLRAITGQFGFVLKPEDMWLKLAVKTNVGSTYVEGIVQQQNHRYLLESTRGEPGLDRIKILRELMDKMGFDGAALVGDGGREQQVQFATLQACETYLGHPVIIDPDQDHEIAIKVKTSFVKDRQNTWNTTPEYAVNGPLLIEQIMQHQKILELQMQMQLAQQQMQVAQAQLGIAQEDAAKEQQKQRGASANPTQAPATAGEVARQGAGA